MKKLMTFAIALTALAGCAPADSDVAASEAVYCEYGSKKYDKLLNSGHVYHVIAGKRVHDPNQCYLCVGRKKGIIKR